MMKGNHAASNEKGGNRWFIASITFTATLGGLLFGYDTAVISGTVKSLEKFFISSLLSDPEYGASVASQYKVVVGISWMIIAVILASMVFRMFGRRKAIRVASAILAGFLFVILVYFIQQVVIDQALVNSVKGFTVSSALIGCIIGGAISGWISIRLGRKKGLILAAFLFAISALGSSLPDTLNIFYTQDIIAFIIYRIIGGIGVGIASMLAPMYIAEIAPAKMRGKLVSWNQFAIIFGMLVIYFVNYYIARGQPQDWIDTTGWRWMFASELVPASLFFLMLFFIPETPRYLVMIGEEAKAEEVLQKINGKAVVQEMVQAIRKSFETRSGSWLAFGWTVIIIGILLSVFQQFVGINVVLYYAPEIFRTLGEGTDAALLQTIIIGAINLLFTVLAIFTVDRFGRKKLMIIGAIGMAVSMLSLGTVFYSQHMGILALVFMLTYIAGFAMSWGPVTWVLLSEIFPNSVRGVMSLAVAAQWIANLLISWTFPVLNESEMLTRTFHHGFAYWIYGFMGILAALFVWRFVPETKGKSLEALENTWRSSIK
jgi:SP family xylose:H+ symportor-like MFS transporter